MKSGYFTFIVVIIFIFITVACTKAPEINTESEKKEIKQAINSSIGWALNKDKDLLYSVLAQDDDFFIFHPDNNTIKGFDNFSKMVELVFMNDAFKATKFEVKDLKINLSGSGTVSWFSCYLDDHGEWYGKPSSWINSRWTGVLEKREGKWVIVQMHFSFAKED